LSASIFETRRETANQPNIKTMEVMMMTEQNNNFESSETAAAPDAEQVHEDAYSSEDIEKGKTMAGLAYLIFFLPLVVCPDSKYGRFHANQGLLLLILAAAGNIILSIIPIVGWILLPLFNIFTLVLFIMGLVNGFGGKATRLPVIGKFDIIK